MTDDMIARRRLVGADTQLALKTHPLFADFLMDVLHFAGPARDERDMVLQNAAKTILNVAGWWGDSDDDRKAILQRLTGINVPRPSLWQKLFRRKG